MAVVSSMQHSFVCCVLFLFIIISQGSAQLNGYFCDYNKVGNYTANGTYGNNLNTVLWNLTSNKQIDYGFYNSSYGENPDRVNAIGLCRGDVEQNECRSCLLDSRGNLTQRCPNQKEAIIWFDNCMLRYSNHSIFGRMETSPWLHMWNMANATDMEQFNDVLGSLMHNLTERAASGDSRRKYAAGNASAPNFESIYGLVQCTPDLSRQDCSNCLVGAVSEIPSCCNGKRGGRVVTPSCNIRYESYRFYYEPATATATAHAPASSP
ncbi:hypothetical protein VNO78_19279 [Psophocarpus tetragonolobus]|uniref:Gnk2-homologous domain-containing protein n=1 Tax=Psophocarpus tetragonolobus TaxID=3891 RepID=A0AAN9S8Y3_PSOTE